MSEHELKNSDVYEKNNIVFEKNKKYLIKANSGKGKSSLLNFIYGNNTNFSGKILHNESPIKDIFELRKSKISYVFQDLKLFPSLSLFENIQLKNKLTDNKKIEEIDNLIELVSLSHKRDSLVSTLSFGQRQRVAVIRALCQPFEYILLDEPFSHLDTDNTKIIIKMLLKEVNKQNACVIMTSLGSLAETKLLTFDKVLNL